MSIIDFFQPGKITLPHHARQMASTLGYNNDTLYDNINLRSDYVSCTYDILYPHDVVPIHTHNYYEIALCESGSAQHLTEQQCFQIKKGDITIIPPGVRHCPAELKDMSAPYKRIMFFISENLVNAFLQAWPQYEKSINMFKEPRHFQTIGTVHENLWKYFEDGITNTDSESPYHESYLYGLIFCLLTKILEASDSTLIPTTRGKSKLVEQIIAYVELHFAEKITLQNVADHFHVSKSSITRLFQHTMGCSFHDYIIQTRLDEAKKMIQDDVNLEIIAESVGFGDYSNFYRSFKKEYGITPSEYRQNLSLLNSFLTEKK